MGFTGAATSTEQGPVLETSRVAAETRRFHLSDAMLPTVAVALGLATTRVMSGVPPTINNRWLYAQVLACWVAIFVGLTLPFLRFRAPCMPWQQLVRQPGFVACLALNASLLFRMILNADMLAWPPPGSRSGGWWGFLGLLVYPNQNACSVVAAWVTLAACGLWKPEASWPDRLGRALGVFWLCAAILVRVGVRLSLL
jgi:hypothetical protein